MSTRRPRAADLPPGDEVLACVDLVGRSGARNFEIGYTGDDARPRWYAHAQYRGTRLVSENHPTPEAAADGLVRRLLGGAKCRCGRLVATSAYGAVAYEGSTLLTGDRWTSDQARRAGQCLWRRTGPRWEPSCTAPPIALKGGR